MNILRQIDNLRIFEQPYNDHYAADKDEVTRSHYVALLLMVLLSEGAISEPQQRMLDLWLPAIGLTGQQTRLCELAERLAKDKLGDAIELIKQDPSLIRGLLLDIMVFARVDKPLDKQTISLLELLAGYFELKDREVGDIVHLAIFILGLPTDSLIEPPYDMTLSPYNVWMEFLYDYRPNAAKRLFAWADKQGIPSSCLPRNLNALCSVKKLSNLDYKRDDATVQWESIPEELYLLENLESLAVDSHRLTEIPPSIGQLKSLKCLTLLSLNVSSLPKELAELRSLQKFKIHVVGDHVVGNYMYFARRASVGRINELTSVPREVVQFIKLNGIDLDVSPSIELLFK